MCLNDVVTFCPVGYIGFSGLKSEEEEEEKMDWEFGFFLIFFEFGGCFLMCFDVV